MIVEPDGDARPTRTETSAAAAPAPERKPAEVRPPDDAEVVPLLRAVNTAFDPATIHDPTDQEYKELATGRRHPWAEDRVM